MEKLGRKIRQISNPNIYPLDCLLLNSIRLWIYQHKSQL